MTGGQKFALGLIVGGGVLLAISRSSDAKTVTGNGTPTNKPPTAPTDGRLRPTTPTGPLPVPQVPADLVNLYTTDRALLERVAARIVMEMDALGVPPVRDDASQEHRAMLYLRSRGITAPPPDLDLTQPGPIVIWTARKIDEELRRRFYLA
jgi:hypothetical protein